MIVAEAVTNEPKLVRAAEGSYHTMGLENVRIVLSSSETGGGFLLAEVWADEPNVGPIFPHMHTHEDEAFTVLTGELHVTIGGVLHVVRPGDTLYAPRNVPHMWRSGPNGVRFLGLATGSNFERFWRRMAKAASLGQEDRIPGIAEEHGLKFFPE